MRSLRIAHVVHGFPPEVIGGTELYASRLVAAQVEQGHQVSVFAGSLEWRPQVDVDRNQENGITLWRVHRDDLYFDRWDKGFHPGVSARFREFLLETRPELVHVHHWIRLSTDLVAIADELGIPAVVTLHDLFPSCPRVFRLKGEHGDQACEVPLGRADCVPCVPRWRFDRDDAVAANLQSYRADMRSELLRARARIAPSATHGEFLKRMLEVDAPLAIVPHGRIAPPLSTAPESQDGVFRVAYFSHLQPLKGAHLLLEAVARSAHRDRIEVHLHGAAVDAPYKQRLEQLASGLRVVFHGAYERATLASRPIDLAVLPTLCRESWSFILDEAFDLGCPILAARTGALEERANGRVRLFERNDAGDLAAQLDALIADPELRSTMRRTAAPRLSEFSEHVAAIESIYAQALAEPTTTAQTAPNADRLADAFRRREHYFRELVAIEKWEDVVNELRSRIAELERHIRDSAGR